MKLKGRFTLQNNKYKFEIKKDLFQTPGLKIFNFIFILHKTRCR
jgi:hypothetical protein